MKISLKYLFILVLFFIPIILAGQTDKDPPKSPVFTFVTINQANGNTEMTWTLSPDNDVAGYVIYLYKDKEGYAIDTIFNPAATFYSVFRPFTAFYSESYVIAAIDSSGNISPLSNELSTIFTDNKIDTCNNRINIFWNKYLSVPVKVTGYDIFASVNSGTYYLAGHVTENTTSFSIGNYINNAGYCFIVKAILENGLVSGSNKKCVNVKTQIPPLWINADFATISTEGAVLLSFTIDPMAETDNYIIERKSGYNGFFQQISQIRTNLKSIMYTDKSGDKGKVNFYRISAYNICNVKVMTSNEASNILLGVQNTGNNIILTWNGYQRWNGTITSYRLFTDTGNGYTQTNMIQPSDTVFSLSIPDIMYSLTGGKVCFYLIASESGNPYGIAGESKSNDACLEIEEVITIPNVFSPDGDLKNDLFKPVLTFTPSEYRLLVSNRQGKELFETNDYLEAWDGSDHGDPVAEGVYLWFLRIKTQEGRKISRTGTITVVKN